MKTLSSIWGITSHLSRNYNVGGMLTGAVTGMLGKKDIKNATGNIDTAASRALQMGVITDQEKAQYEGSFQLGDLIKQMQEYQMGLGPAPSGYLNPQQQYERQTGDLGTALYNTALKDVQDPYAAYESTLQPQLQAANDYINTQYQKRGLLQSGLNLESMGRAGVDLAIQEAQGRMQARSDALSRGGAMSDTLQNTNTNNLANLSNLYGQQQGYGQNAMARQAGQALGVLPTQVQPFQAQLGYGYGQLAAGQKAVTSGASQGINSLGSGGLPGLSSSLFANK